MGKAVIKCDCCGLEFLVKMPHQKYCSKKCRGNAYRLANPEKASAYTRKWVIANKEKVTARKSRVSKDPGRKMVNAYYCITNRRAAYSGTIEEYVYYLERRAIQVQSRLVEVERRRQAWMSRPTAGMTDAQAYKYYYYNNPAFRLWERQRNQFKKWMKGKTRGNSLSRALGYSREDLLSHLERQFIEGMSWDNMGEWHIDHIKPKNLFNPTDHDQLRECWSLANLRPLWASLNCSRPKDGSDVLAQALEI